MAGERRSVFSADLLQNAKWPDNKLSKQFIEEGKQDAFPSYIAT